MYSDLTWSRVHVGSETTPQRDIKVSCGNRAFQRHIICNSATL